MKISWGTGITAVYVFFVIALLAAVFVFMNQDVHLVTDDYYAKEIAYQQQIDKVNRTQSLNAQLKIKPASGFVGFAFPRLFKSNEINGKIHFYRPSDNSKDFFADVKVDSANSLEVATAGKEKGMWKVKVDWNAKGNSYYNEKIIMIN